MYPVWLQAQAGTWSEHLGSRRDGWPTKYALNMMRRATARNEGKSSELTMDAKFLLEVSKGILVTPTPKTRTL